MTTISAKAKLRTRDGCVVQKWFSVDRPADTFFPIRAVICRSDGTTEEHPYTRSGRRYINVESGLDLIQVSAPKKRGLDGSRELDCMPDVLRAIECVRSGNMAGVRSANKVGDAIGSVISATVSIGVIESD